MATTTTNFGWTVPSDTDLVKDGAAAIRTALGGVDTSFVDLKGGTTGQVLAKNSNTDLDFVWSADASGIPATIFDAKGDLIAASAADTAARLAVGTNGQVLTADSTAATGIKWAGISAVPSNDSASVLDEEATTSTAYTDLATSGAAVTVTTGTKAFVMIGCLTQLVASGQNAYVSFAVSGATTLGASDKYCIMNQNTTLLQMGNGFIVEGLTAGSNTFTMKYRTKLNSSNGYFSNRIISVIDMGS